MSRYWILGPEDEPFKWAKPTDRFVPCQCCAGSHQAVVKEDGSIYCEATDTYVVATAANPELFEMRKQFERGIVEMCRATELS